MIKDYFKVNFKLPEITEPISQIIKKKSELKNKLDFCYSRLETIEICNSNSKPTDALILANHLAVDILNLSLLFLNRSTISISDNWKETAKSLPDSKLNDYFHDLLLILESEENDEEKSERVEVSLLKLLESVEKYIFKTNHAQFKNPIEEYKKKLAVQSTIVLLLLGSIVVYFKIVEFNKNKPITIDTAKLYFMNENSPKPVNSNLITSNVKPTKGWLEVSFPLQNPSEINEIKIEPVHQWYAKIQLKDIKYLDANKQVIYQSEFKLDRVGPIEYKLLKEFCCLKDLITGKLQPGKYTELESRGNNPSFKIKTETFKDVKEIILTMRYIKNNMNFPD